MLADHAEGMDVPIALARPVLEGDRELDGAARGPQKFAFVEVEDLVKTQYRGEGRFADANGADLLGFDQRDVEHCPELLGQRRRGAPTRSSAAGNDDFAHVRFFHVSSPPDNSV